MSAAGIVRALALLIGGGLLPVVSRAQSSSMQPVLHTSATMEFNWDNHAGVRIEFRSPPVMDGPGEFTQVRVYVPGHSVAVFNNENAWARTSDRQSVPDPLPSSFHNLLPTDYLVAIQTGPHTTTLLLIGANYGCCLGGLEAIGITPAGEVTQVLHLDAFDAEEFRDYGQNQYALIGRTCLGEQFGDPAGTGVVTTYNPFDVFLFGAGGGQPARLSIRLSRAYNQKHYYGWAGAGCSETDPIIVLPKNGKPYLRFHGHAVRHR